MTTIERNIWVAIALAAAVLVPAAIFPTAFVQAAETEVNIDQFTFYPQRITVKAGTTVTWTNEDDVPHTVASSQVLQVEGARYGEQILVHVHNAWHV
jgi:plastocyanin